MTTKNETATPENEGEEIRMAALVEVPDERDNVTIMETPEYQAQDDGNHFFHLYGGVVQSRDAETDGSAGPVFLTLISVLDKGVDAPESQSGLHLLESYDHAPTSQEIDQFIPDDFVEE